MSPEVFQDGALAMPADVYSFSMLMLELWTGEPIFKGDSLHQVRQYRHPVPRAHTMPHT
jgi:hypothetical protein